MNAVKLQAKAEVQQRLHVLQYSTLPQRQLVIALTLFVDTSNKQDFNEDAYVASRSLFSFIV